MSANNGNRSRFNIDRKRRIARRMQMREVAKALNEKQSTAAATDSAPVATKPPSRKRRAAPATDAT